jgi:cytochrome b pre-mRNA-processing protein 3
MRGMLGVTPEHGFGKASAIGGVATVIFGLFGKRPDRMAPVNALLARIVVAAREPALYLEGRVPDDFEGRFEALTLYVFLVLRRLRELPEPAAEVAQDLVDANFSYLELGFRQGGVGDVSVPKRLKKIGRSFYGRVGAYEEAFAATAEPGALADALSRNVSPQADAEALARHARAVTAHLATLDLDGILTADPIFPQFASILSR